MLKAAYDQGAAAALERFKVARGIRPAGLNVVPSQRVQTPGAGAPSLPRPEGVGRVQHFAQGQATHLEGLGHGMRSWLGGGPNAGAGRAQTMQSLRGLAPTIAGGTLAAGGLGYLFGSSGDDRR